MRLMVVLCDDDCYVGGRPRIPTRAHKGALITSAVCTRPACAVVVGRQTVSASAHRPDFFFFFFYQTKPTAVARRKYCVVSGPRFPT